MKELLIYTLPLALIAAQAAVPRPWVGEGQHRATSPTRRRRGNDTLLMLVQHRRGGGGANVNQSSVNRTSVNRTNFNGSSFHRDVSVNRNVVVTGGNYEPNLGGVAAGVAVSVGVTAAATAAANSVSYPPLPYPYTPYGY
jgi:hypothetical protein